MGKGGLKALQIKLLLALYFLAVAMVFKYFIKEVPKLLVTNNLFNIQQYQMVFDFSHKIKLLSEVFMWFGVYFFSITVMISFRRMTTNRVLQINVQDEPIVQSMNNALRNSIEQILIFAPNLIYYALSNKSQFVSESQKAILVLSFGLWFLLGRILFLFSYVLEAAFNFKWFRQLGYCFGLGLNLLLILENFNVPVIGKYI